MSKSNGNNSPVRPTLETIPLRDGLNIFAMGEGEVPSEVQLILKVPGMDSAPQLIFREPKLLVDVIEALIAYLYYVFPDAPEIDTRKTIQEVKKNYE